MRLLEPRRDGGAEPRADRRRCAHAVVASMVLRARDPRVGLSLAAGRARCASCRRSSGCWPAWRRSNAGSAAIHAITLAFGATLLGEAVDYPSYLLTQMRARRVRAARRARASADAAPRGADHGVRRVALLFSGFPGLAQLGAADDGRRARRRRGHAVGAAALACPRTWRPRCRRDLAVARASPRCRGCAVALVRRRVAVVRRSRSPGSEPWWDDDLAT